MATVPVKEPYMRHTTGELMYHFRIIVMLVLVAVIPASAEISTNRPAGWARKLSLAGVPNCYLVTTNLYRGAQPTSEGMAQLKELGVRYVVSLRMLRNDRLELGGTGIKCLNLSMVPWHPNETDVVKFLKAATDTNNLPLFIHCRHGADRTGLMCAMYRIVVCDWKKEEALAEMRDGGFHFNPAWKSIVSFIENADVDAYKRRIGLLDVKGDMAKVN